MLITVVIFWRRRMWQNMIGRYTFGLVIAELDPFVFFSVLFLVSWNYAVRISMVFHILQL